jgi:hypothetical protein
MFHFAVFRFKFEKQIYEHFAYLNGYEHGFVASVGNNIETNEY